MPACQRECICGFDSVADPCVFAATPIVSLCYHLNIRVARCGGLRVKWPSWEMDKCSVLRFGSLYLSTAVDASSTANSLSVLACAPWAASSFRSSRCIPGFGRRCLGIPIDCPVFTPSLSPFSSSVCLSRLVTDCCCSAGMTSCQAGRS